MVLAACTSATLTCSDDFRDAVRAVETGDLSRARTHLASIKRSSGRYDSAVALGLHIDYLEDSIAAVEDSGLFTQAKKLVDAGDRIGVLALVGTGAVARARRSRYGDSLDALVKLASAAAAAEDEAQRMAATAEAERFAAAELREFCESTNSAKAVLRKMYEQLRSFRSTPEFKRYGFAPGTKYHPWLVSLREVNERMLATSELDRRVFVLYVALQRLEQLALEYASSKPDANSMTWMRQEIEEGLAFDCRSDEL
jgi:hypothetical protein